MATNILVAQVPCGAGRGFNSFTFTWNGDATTELGKALNGAFGSFLSAEWTNDGGFPFHSSTPPVLPIAFSAPMWDAGTNSPDGQLPATVVISNVRIQANPAILASAVATNNLFTLKGRIVNGGDHNSAPVVYSVDTHPSIVTFDYPLSPMTGLAWTRAELFASDFGILLESVDTWAPGVNGSSLIYYPFPSLGFGSNQITGFQVIVTYTSGGTTYEVATAFDAAPALSDAGSGTGKGGVHEVTLGAEPTIDSHLGSGLVIDVPTTNRWELQRFSVRPTKQGDR